jgi:glycerate kinase
VIYFAQTALDAQVLAILVVIGGFAVLILAVIGLATILAAAFQAADAAPAPCCPWCGARLKRVETIDMERPPPSGATWYCNANHSIHESFNRPWTCYFSDRPAAKPAPSEEV